MKISFTTTLICLAFFFVGCASQESASSQGEPATGTGSSDMSEERSTAKTAYEGSTGSGLLMERYKSGAIEGFRN